MSDAARHSKLAIVLHWTLAALILTMLAAGFPMLPTSDPRKIGILAAHMMVGMTILMLTLLRLVVRLRTSRRRGAAGKTRPLKVASKLAQAGSYILVLAMTGSGLAAAVMSGLNQIVFGATGQPLPADMSSYAAFGVHRALAIVLTALIAAHVAIIAYEHFVRKSRPLARMSFRRLSSDSPSDGGGH